VLAAVERTFDQLARQPQCGVSYPTVNAKLREVRMLPVDGFADYLIFCRLVPDAVRILYVVHGARHLPPVVSARAEELSRCLVVPKEQAEPCAVWESALSLHPGVVEGLSMTTLTIELPDDAARLATEKAHRAHLTLADWVRVRIAGRRRSREAGESDSLGYPPGWFERTCGSLADVEVFREPADPAAAPVPPIEL